MAPNQLKRGSSHDATVLTGNFSLIILDVHVVKSSLLDIGGEPALSIGMAEIGDSLSHCDGMVAFWNLIRKYTWHFPKLCPYVTMLIRAKKIKEEKEEEHDRDLMAERLLQQPQ